MNEKENAEKAIEQEETRHHQENYARAERQA